MARFGRTFPVPRAKPQRQVLAVSSGTAWTATPGDSVTMSDALAFQFSVTVADSVTMSDAQAFQTSVTVADSVTMSDAQAFQRSVTISDSVTMSDGTTQDSGKGVSQGDSVTMSDAQTFDRAITITDTVTMTDTLAFQRSVTITDTVTMTDQTALQRSVTVTDSVSMSDGQAIVRGVTVALNDSVTMSDFADPVKTAGGSFADPPRTRFTRSQGLRRATVAIGTLGLTNTTGLTGVRHAAGALGLTTTERFAGPTPGFVPLGYSNQALGGTDVAAMQTLIGRQFHGLRQNADISTNWVNTGQHISEFDLGRTFSYRACQNDPATESYAAAIAGTYDARFTTTVTNIKNSGRWSASNPFVLCYGHEVTVASWDPLGTKQQFIDAFRHFRVLLDSLGCSVRTVTGAAGSGPIVMAYIGWDRMFTNGAVNSPTAGKSYTDYDPDQGSSPAPAGTTYYTYAGSDVYNNLVGGVVQYGTNAATLLDDVRAQAVSRGKDWIIGEIGCSDGPTAQNHTDKAAWWDSVRTYLDALGRTGPGVCRGMNTTIKTSSELYNIDSSPESIAAWQRLGADSYYS